MYTAKQAMLVRDHYPDVNVHVFYIDVRTPGKNFDEFYRRAVEEFSVDYIKGQVGKMCIRDRHNSFYFSEEIFSASERKKNIRVRDRATL